MTYEEQLKIEKLSKEVFERIITTITPDEFINFYKTHNKKETKDFYQINNDKTLKRILNFFNYDWSFRKSLNKGKTSTRSHESYVAGGQKSATTQKANWQIKSAEDKKAWSEKQKEAHSTESFKQKIKQININYQKSLTIEQKEIIAKKRQTANKATWDKNKKTILEKAYQTKKSNKSFNSSQIEDIYYEKLCNKYHKEDILRQYKDERYPFACDFYIKSIDTFIELNFNWTHGGHKFDANNKYDQQKLLQWKEKAEGSDFYKKAIDVWTRLDIEKFACAEKNHLNYIVYYSEDELDL